MNGEKLIVFNLMQTSMFLVSHRRVRLEILCTVVGEARKYIRRALARSMQYLFDTTITRDNYAHSKPDWITRQSLKWAVATWNNEVAPQSPWIHRTERRMTFIITDDLLCLVPTPLCRQTSLTCCSSLLLIIFRLKQRRSIHSRTCTYLTLVCCNIMHIFNEYLPTTCQSWPKAGYIFQIQKEILGGIYIISLSRAGNASGLINT